MKEQLNLIPLKISEPTTSAILAWFSNNFYLYFILILSISPISYVQLFSLSVSFFTDVFYDYFKHTSL